MVLLDESPASPTPVAPTVPSTPTLGLPSQTSSPVAAAIIPPPSHVPTTPTTELGQLIVEAGELSWVHISHAQSAVSDTRVSVQGGCDPSGCIQEHTRVRALLEEAV